MELSIIIVAYNSKKYIYECINSIIESNIKVEFEISIVDNSPNNETMEVINTIVDKYKNNKIKVIRCENKGFNHANNIGIRNSTGKYIMLLNPDTIVKNNQINKLLFKAKEITNLGAIGPRVLTKNEEYNITRIFYPSVKDGILRLLNIRNQKSALLSRKEGLIRVDSPTGAAYMFKREIIQEIGYLDENYFLYFDEMDFSKRMDKIGKKNYVYTGSEIIHYQGVITSELNDYMYDINMKSYVRFLNKNYSSINRNFIKIIFIVENLVKYIIFSMFKKERSLYYKKSINNFIKCKDVIK